MAHYASRIEKVHNLEAGKSLTDKFVAELIDELALFEKTREYSNGLSAAYTAGQYEQTKKEWISKIESMDLSKKEQLELIEYYEEKVSNVHIDYK